jgi:hypothetical protein
VKAGAHPSYTFQKKARHKWMLAAGTIKNPKSSISRHIF